MKIECTKCHLVFEYEPPKDWDKELMLFIHCRNPKCRATVRVYDGESK